jgi:hypothetical protein
MPPSLIKDCNVAAVVRITAVSSLFETRKAVIGTWGGVPGGGGGGRGEGVASFRGS